MMWICFALIGAMVGAMAHRYIAIFPNQLKQEVWQAYLFVFIRDSAEIPAVSPQLKPINCLSLPFYILFSIAFSLICYAITENTWSTIIYLCYVALVICIARIDLAYQLISVHLCQLLLALGIFSAWLGVSELTLEQSLLSALIGFVSFYAIYALAKIYYGREALGRGDYWLILGLASFIRWQQLPLLVFIACLCGIFYVLAQKLRGQLISQIPFAPFLIAGEIGLWLLNYF